MHEKSIREKEKVFFLKKR